jgi:small conductance mechanosensitive channel
MPEDLQKFYDQAFEILTLYGFSIVGAMIILIVGFWFAGLAKRLTVRGLRKTGRIDETIVLFFASMVKYLVVAFTVLAVLDQFGVQTTSLIALFGAAGLAVGLALQGTLSNVAAGVMLLFFRPFKVGDFVDAGGSAGSVKSVSLFTTHLDTGDNVHIIVPNSQIWGSAISNYSHNPTRRIELTIGIGYGDDIEKAIGVVRQTIEADKRSLADPEPLVEVSNLGDSSVDLLIRVWSKSGDYWGLKWGLTRAIKEAFDREGIEIPYPHRVIQSQTID